MRILHRALLVALPLLVIALVWIWFNRPQPVDMSQFAPASSLVYLESNSLLGIADGITATDTWKQVRSLVGETNSGWPSSRTRRFVELTGIAPTSSVVLARAQVAMVMLDLGAREDGETVTLKPEVAVLIETHSSKFRIKSTVEQALQTFAERLYTRPTFKRVGIDADEFMVWTAADGNRQIVAIIDDSLVIVANSDRAVKACLEAKRGLRPSLKNDPDLQQMRNKMTAQGSLAFGFVPASHAAELLRLATPVVLGKPPDGSQVDALVARSAAKVFSSAAWNASVVNGAIEDHYSITLNPAIASRMRPVFRAAGSAVPNVPFVPENFYSVTVYNLTQPDKTWRELLTSLSSQVDTLSAVLLTSVLKAGLENYGITDPEKFLQLVGPEILTLRSEANEPSSVLIARVRDEAGLRDLMKTRPEPDSSSKEIKPTVLFQGGYVLMGAADAVQRCVQAAQSNQEHKLVYLGPEPTSSIVTYADDSGRVASFISALTRAQNSTAKVTDEPGIKQQLKLGYAVTQTSLSETSLERRTLSPFGQFSTLMPLLFPDR